MLIVVSAAAGREGLSGNSDYAGYAFGKVHIEVNYPVFLRQAGNKIL